MLFLPKTQVSNPNDKRQKATVLALTAFCRNIVAEDFIVAEVQRILAADVCDDSFGAEHQQVYDGLLAYARQCHSRRFSDVYHEYLCFDLSSEWALLNAAVKRHYLVPLVGGWRPGDTVALPVMRCAMFAAARDCAVLFTSSSKFGLRMNPVLAAHTEFLAMQKTANSAVFTASALGCAGSTKSFARRAMQAAPRVQMGSLDDVENCTVDNANVQRMDQHGNCTYA